MDEKEFERKMQESADKIEVRDFALVWEDIKDTLDPPPDGKRKSWRWKPALLSTACVAVACAILIPIALNNPAEEPLNQVSNSSSQSNSSPQVYYDDDLQFIVTPFESLLGEFTLANIEVVDLQGYEVISCSAVKTSTGLVVGGEFNVTDNLENSTFLLNMTLYTEDVTVNEETEKTYDSTYTVNGAVVEYRVKESYPDDGIYIYDIKANYKDVNYYMEYTGFSEDITAFFNEFFS